MASHVPLELGAGASNGVPQEELKNSILFLLLQPEPNLPDRGSKGLFPPQNWPSGSWEGYEWGWGERGESLDKVS